MTHLPVRYIAAFAGTSVLLILLGGYAVFGGEVERWLIERRRQKRKGFIQ